MPFKKKPLIGHSVFVSASPALSSMITKGRSITEQSCVVCRVSYSVLCIVFVVCRFVLPNVVWVLRLIVVLDVVVCFHCCCVGFAVCVYSDRWSFLFNIFYFGES